MVHVVDDDESWRIAVSRLLRAAGYEVCTYASAGEFALGLDQGLNGCLLLDVRMPGPSGLELQASLARHGLSLPVVFLTGHGDIPMSVRAMKAGAIDFLTKPVQSAQLLAAIDTALARDADNRRTRAYRQECQDRLDRLTPREREVFERVIAGQPNKQIAAELNAAERTIKAHRARVMEKMEAASLADLVRLAEQFRHGGGRGSGSPD